MSRTVTWYFDFISPFAYLQFRHFERLPPTLEVTLVPVLFAGLLEHWEHKGPAEIPAKRIQTYRYCHWLARRLQVPFRAPPAHPFNPLKALRLAIGLGPTREVVAEIFAHIWADGGDVQGESGFTELAARLGVTNAAAVIAEPAIKRRLRDNTEAAIAAGVFGVPTFAVDGELFWGFDSTDLFLDYLEDPALYDDPEMQRLATMPSAAVRRA